MRVCYWSPNCSPACGGTGKYERYLPQAMRRLGVATEYVVSPFGALGVPLTFRRVARFDGDVVHAITQTLSLYAYPRSHAFVVTVHDVFTKHRSLVSRVKRRVLPVGLRRVDRIIAASAFTKRELTEAFGIRDSAITVVPMGVDHTLYRMRDRAQCKRRFGLNPAVPHVLVVASTDPHKRMDLTRSVFQRVAMTRRDVRLLKCGYGTRLEGPGIVNLGMVPEAWMPILYNAADVLLLTSEYEGFGMPLLEAMACGTPIVASRAAAIPEVLDDGGELVDLDAQECVAAFAEKILHALDRDTRNVRGHTRSRAFSWDQTAKRTLHVYRQLLD